MTLTTTLTLSQASEESNLEYSLDSSYHKAPSAGEDRVLMVPIGDLEIHRNASELEVPSDAVMETSEGSSAETWSMSPLHLEEEGPPIVTQEELDLMSRVLDEQLILRSSMSGQRCIRSAGALPLAKYHHYIHSLFFKDQLRGVPSTETFRSNYLRARRTGRVKYHRSGREADDECSGAESSYSSLKPEGLDDLTSPRVVEPGHGSDSDPTTLAACASQSHGDS